METLLVSLQKALEADGFDYQRVALAWARYLPTVLLVPAFGLRALAGPVRGALALVLVVGVSPAVHAMAPGSFGAIALLNEALRGLPPALSAAVALWGASMAGALIDDLRAGPERSLPLLAESGGAVGTLLGIFAGVAFLETGGPARVAEALFLSHVERGSDELSVAAANLASGVNIAIAIGAPVLVAALLFDVASALYARASSPAPVLTLLGALRAVGLLLVVLVLLEHLGVAVVWLTRRAP